MKSLSIVLPIVLLVVQQAARADLNASLVDNLGDVHSITVAPGATFVVDILLDTDIPLTAASVHIQELTSSGLFTLDSLVFNDAVWNAPTDTTPVFGDPTPQALVLGNAYTSGEIYSAADNLVDANNDFAADVGTGTGAFTLASVTVTISALAVDGSTYHLNLVNMLFGDLGYDAVSPTAITRGTDYLVNVSAIPAPGALILGWIGLAACTRFRRRPV